MTAVLSDFKVHLPAKTHPQAELIDWVAGAHALAMAPERRDPGKMRKLAERYGCGPQQISMRALELGDPRQGFLGCDPGRGELPGMERRMEFFKTRAEEALEALYRDESTPPAHLIHVTCTGYVSPSAAQVLAVRRGWQGSMEVTHAYHMGCYAAFPALRIARGLVASGTVRVDLVHTEICSLHVHPEDHRPEAWVVQTLFGDGHIRYSLSSGTKSPALEVLRIRELLLDSSLEQMSWICSDQGMRMTLSREVPSRIHGMLGKVIAELEVDVPDLNRNAIFAVHPGGPRIVDGVQDTLRLSPEQVRHSRETLFYRGNLSSATVPHIWKSILEDPGVKAGTPIVSLAFGPGLTVFSALLRKK